MRMRPFRSPWPCWRHSGSGRGRRGGNIKRRRWRQYDLGLDLGCGPWTQVPRQAAARRWRLSAPAVRRSPPWAPAFEWRRRYHLRPFPESRPPWPAALPWPALGGAGLGAAIFLLVDALALGALPFDAALPACGAGRATGAACFAARGRATGSTCSNSGSAGTATYLAFLVTPGRLRPIGPVHIGLARTAAGLSVDIDDVGRIERFCLQRSGRTEEQDQGQQSPISRHDYSVSTRMQREPAW